MTPDFLDDVAWLHRVMRETGIQPSARMAADWLECGVFAATCRLLSVPGVWRYRRYPDEPSTPPHYRYALEGQECAYPPKRARKPKRMSATSRLRAVDQWAHLPTTQAAQTCGITPRRVRQIRQGERA